MKERILQIMPISHKLASASERLNVLGLALVEEEGQVAIKFIGINAEGSLQLTDNDVSEGTIHFHCS